MSQKERIKVSVIDFSGKYAKDFETINIDWLEKYFYVEEYDRKVLSDPQKHILDPGGKIFFASINMEIAGTVALIKRGDSIYELSKMGVHERFHGFGIGKKLIERCIEFCKNGQADRLFLDSNKKLKHAIKLYSDIGFVEIPVPEDTPYERCDIRMNYKL